jgi:hypothetical protein
MTTTTPLFTPHGDGYDLTAPGVLLVMADTLYGEDREHISKAGFVRISESMAALFRAASTGGFTQGDILMTLLCRGENSKRVQDMARAACDAAGDKAITQFFASLRNKPKGQQ